LCEVAQIQPVVASDLARLLAIKQHLSSDYQRVVWCDSDFLVINPERLKIPDTTHAFGREVWIQNDSKNPGKLRAYKGLHNAFMFFDRSNPFLDFYIDSICRMFSSLTFPVAPQIAGPKFLTAIHNITHQCVIEEAAMLSPQVLLNLLSTRASEQSALQLFQEKSSETPAGLNLCASMVSGGVLTNSQLMRAVDTLTPQMFDPDTRHNC